MVIEALEKRKHHIVVVDMRLPVYGIGEQIIRYFTFLLNYLLLTQGLPYFAYHAKILLYFILWIVLKPIEVTELAYQDSLLYGNVN